MSALAVAIAVRVFSADFCADQFVLAIADRSEIIALSQDATRDFSYMREEAAGLPRVRADAEQVVARSADLVLRFWGGDPARFERFDVETVTLDYASDFNGVKNNVRLAANALGHPERGDAIIADMERRLADLAGPEGPRPKALYVTPGGVTAGRGTMIDAILTAAGVVNIASEKGLEGWPPLPLEQIVLDQPDLVITGFFEADANALDHWSVARHPAFDRVFEEGGAIHLPADVISCPAASSVDAAEFIRGAIERGARAP